MIQPCDTMEFTSITKKNACHISNTNDELGSVKVDMFAVKTDMKHVKEDVVEIKTSVSAVEAHSVKTDLTMTQMKVHQEISMWFTGIIMVAIIGGLVSIAIKKLFGSNK